jgi:hypothetical protein
MTNGPVAPAQTPVLWTLLAWVRREIGQTLSKGTAVARESLRVVLVLVNGRVVLVLVNIGVSHTGGKSECGRAHEARGGDLLQIGHEHHLSVS